MKTFLSGLNTQIKNSLFSDCTAYFEFNLTKDTVTRNLTQRINGKEKDISNEFKLGSTYSYTELIDSMAKNFVFKNKEKFAETFSRDALLSLYKKGETSVHLVYWTRDNNNRTNILLQTVFLLKKKIKNEIIGVSFFRDASEIAEREEKYNRQFSMLTKLTEDYVAVGYVNLDTNEHTTLRLHEAFDSLHSEDDGVQKYDELVEKFTEKYIYKDDRLSYLENMSASRIKEALTDNGIYFVDYRIVMDNEVKNCELKVVRDSNVEDSFCVIIGAYDTDREAEYERNLRKEIEIALEKEKSYRNAIFVDAFGFYEINITKDKFITDIYQLEKGEIKQTVNVKDSNTGFTEFMKQYLKMNILSKKDVFSKTMNTEYLYNCFKYGNLMPEFTCWQITPFGQKLCCKHTFFLTKEKFSGDVIAICVLRDVTEIETKKESYEHQEKIVKALSDDFEVVFYVDSDRDKIFPVRNSQKEQSLEEINSDGIVYSTEILKLIKADVTDDNRVELENKFSMETVLDVLESHKTYFVPFSILKDKKPLLRQAKFVQIEDKNRTGVHSFVLGIQDIDERARKENETQEQLRLAKLKAESANAAKSAFLFNMSHDIRTPMNAILGFTNIARKNAGNEEKVKDALAKIEVAGNHLLQLISEILDMSRIESGKFTVDLTPANLVDVMEEILVILKYAAQEKGVDLRFDCSVEKSKKVYADILHIKQIVLNVVSNAIKYTRPGGFINFSIKQFPCEKENFSTFKFSVQDTGIGMSKEYITHIYEAFSRENSTTQSKVEGTGLGMSIVKKLLDLMGGTIDIDSKFGEGTSVTFTLELENFEQEENEISQETMLVAAKDIAGKKVLLVEDNEMNREIAIDILEEQGIIVDSAEDGAVAVEMLKNNPPFTYNLVLMDIQMPYMDGYTATKEIRNLPDKDIANIPIAAMTANTFEEDRKKAVEAGMNGYITKPIEIKKLIELLSKY